MLDARVILRFAAVAVVCALGLPNSALAQSDAWASFSARNAKVDTVFDWQMTFGGVHVGEYSKFTAELRRERQDGQTYFDQEYTAAGLYWSFETGAKLVRSEEAQLHLIQVYAERKFWQDRIGLGITRKWSRQWDPAEGYSGTWFPNGETMARLSFFYADSLGPAEVLLNAAYDRNIERQNVSLRLDAPLRYGPLSIGPAARLERIETEVTEGGESRTITTDKWQVMLKVNYRIREAD